MTDDRPETIDRKAPLAGINEPLDPQAPAAPRISKEFGE